MTAPNGQPPAPRTYLTASLGNVAARIRGRVGFTADGDPFALVDLGKVQVIPHSPEECFRIGMAFYNAGRELAVILAVREADAAAERMAADVCGPCADGECGVHPATRCPVCGERLTETAICPACSKVVPARAEATS